MPRGDAGSRRCAIYTRKSSEEGLEQEFNSLAAQREACEAYIRSQQHEGWVLARPRYDDGGFSGGNLERPALQHLLADIRTGRIHIIIVHKVDRLTRSLADFARLVEIFDGQGVSFVSVTQQFNTTSSMGRLTLNVLLSFAQFEREVTGERIRDKIAASKKKGMWMGGNVPLGYDADERTLVINPAEAETVRRIFALYRELGCVRRVKEEADRLGLRTKCRTAANGVERGGKRFSRGHLYTLLSNPIYTGQIVHKGQLHPRTAPHRQPPSN
jgi:DNA invertase Pin-like site-specific DNA recombinase